MLELYNALYDTNYPPDTPVDINTIEEALYLSDKNDIPFTIADTYLIITEHQATINPNPSWNFPTASSAKEKVV